MIWLVQLLLLISGEKQSRAATHMECFSWVKPQSFCTQWYRFCDTHQGNTTGRTTTGFYTVWSYLFRGFLQWLLSKNILRLHCLWDCKMTFSGLFYEFHGLYILLLPNLATIDGVIQRFCPTELLSVPRQIQNLSCAFSFPLIRMQNPSLIPIYQMHFVGVPFSRKYSCSIRKSNTEN